MEQPGLWLDTGSGVLALVREREVLGDKEGLCINVCALGYSQNKGLEPEWLPSPPSLISVSKLTLPRVPALQWG